MYFVQLLKSGKIAYYINPDFSWLAVCAAAMFFLLGFAGAYRLLTHSRSCDGDGCHGRHGSLKAIIVVLLPLILGIAVPPSPLGAENIDDSEIQKMLRENVDMSMLTTADNIESKDLLYSAQNEVMPDKKASCSNTKKLTILDWLRCFTDTGSASAYRDEDVDVVGFVYHTPSLPEGQFLVTRFFMRHCMLDTLPIGLAVSSDNARALKDDTWVRVRGKMGTSGGRPFIQANRVEMITVPVPPYLYP